MLTMPAFASEKKIALLPYHAMGLLQFTHLEAVHISEIFLGILQIQTFKKLPITSPRPKTQSWIKTPCNLKYSTFWFVSVMLINRYLIFK